ncbi:MAG: hypothetical protein ABJB03_03895 [Rhodoglobus sp.]
MAKGLVGVLAIGVSAVALLTGCGPSKPMPTPSASPSPTPTASPTPVAPPTFKPDGTAAQNRKYFDYSMKKYSDVAVLTKADGQSMVDWLVNAGFAKADMEVTPDETSVGLDADAIIVSVRIGDGCLIGQINSSGYHSELGHTLGTGKCLVGQTRPIDW